MRSPARPPSLYESRLARKNVVSPRRPALDFHLAKRLSHIIPTKPPQDYYSKPKVTRQQVQCNRHLPSTAFLPKRRTVNPSPVPNRPQGLDPFAAFQSPWLTLEMKKESQRNPLHNYLYVTDPDQN